MTTNSVSRQDIFLLKLGEVVLKGQNRHSFEDKLVNNVRRRLKGCGSFQVYIRQSTIYVEPTTENCDMEAAFAACRQVFGVVAVARAAPCEKTVAAIVETAKTYLADAFATAHSFKVESKRADKTFHLNSIQLSQEVGGELAEALSQYHCGCPQPGPDGVCGDPGEVRLCPHPRRPRCRRSSYRHGRPGGEPALRRAGQPRVLLDDGPAGRGAGDGPLRLPALHLPPRPRRRCWSWPGC